MEGSDNVLQRDGRKRSTGVGRGGGTTASSSSSSSSLLLLLLHVTCNNYIH
jgi:hypothetical protein